MAKRGGYGASGGGIEGKIEILLLAIVGVIIIVNLLASTVGQVFTQFGYLGSNLTANGVQFGAMFSSGGVIGLIFGVVALLIVIFLLFSMLKGAKHGR